MLICKTELKFFEQVFVKSLALPFWKYHNLLYTDPFTAPYSVPKRTRIFTPFSKRKPKPKAELNSWERTIRESLETGLSWDSKKIAVEVHYYIIFNGWGFYYIKRLLFWKCYLELLNNLILSFFRGVCSKAEKWKQRKNSCRYECYIVVWLSRKEQINKLKSQRIIVKFD